MKNCKTTSFILTESYLFGTDIYSPRYIDIVVGCGIDGYIRLSKQTDIYVKEIWKI